MAASCPRRTLLPPTKLTPPSPTTKKTTTTRCNSINCDNRGHALQIERCLLSADWDASHFGNAMPQVATYLRHTCRNFARNRLPHSAALHIVCERRHANARSAVAWTALAEFLIAHGADVNERDSPAARNWTPLHLAAWTRNLPLVVLLIRCGAHVDALDNVPRTPLEWLRAPPTFAFSYQPDERTLMHGAHELWAFGQITDNNLGAVRAVGSQDKQQAKLGKSTNPTTTTVARDGAALPAPQLVDSSFQRLVKEKRFSSIAISPVHSLYVARDFHSRRKTGSLYVVGSGSEGQLGLGATATQTLLEPRRVQLEAQVQAVAASRHTSMVLTEHGQVYVCGTDHHGQLGLSGNPLKVVRFERVLLASDTPGRSVPLCVSHIYSLDEYSMAVEQKSLFVWGTHSGQFGSLLPDGRERTRLPVTCIPMRHPIDLVACNERAVAIWLSDPGIVMLMHQYRNSTIKPTMFCTAILGMALGRSAEAAGPSLLQLAILAEYGDMRKVAVWQSDTKLFNMYV